MAATQHSAALRIIDLAREDPVIGSLVVSFSATEPRRDFLSTTIFAEMLAPAWLSTANHAHHAVDRLWCVRSRTATAKSAVDFSNCDLVDLNRLEKAEADYAGVRTSFLRKTMF